MRQLMRSKNKRAAALLLSLLGAGASTASRAEVEVSGTVASIQVVSSQEPISGVLSAIAKAFNVRYRSVVTLDDRVSATYSGSVREVASRLLRGYNYVIKQDGSTVEIVVLGKHDAPPVAAEAPASAPGHTFADQWRK